MECVFLFAARFHVLNLEWLLSRKAVMCGTDALRVANGQATVFRREGQGKVAEISEVITDFNLFMAVQKDLKQGVSRTSVVYHLVREE